MNTVAAINPTGAEIHSPETMPHSIEAEQQLLGAILSNNDVFDRADSLISSEHFLTQFMLIFTRWHPAGLKKIV